MKIHLYIFAIIASIITGCQVIPAGKVDDQALVAKELAFFVADLEKRLPTDNSALKVRIGDYLSSHPSVFYGATVALIDSNGVVAYSPYVHRPNGIDLVFSNSLMDPAYQINKQTWLRAPIDQATSVWTEPYFDKGGGDIWMRTHSVPIYQNGKVVGVATTDVRVEKLAPIFPSQTSATAFSKP